MKIHFVFLYLLISSVWAKAAIQAAATQDKPPRLYVKSYIVADNGYGMNQEWHSTTAHGTETVTFNYNINWNDGTSGAGSWMSQDDDGGTYQDIVNWSWPTSSWPNVSGTMIDAYYATGWPGSSTNIYPGESPVIKQEYCDINVPTYTSEGSMNNMPTVATGYIAYQIEQTSDTRTAQTTMKLQTGGKAISKLRNLFGITASATQQSPGDIWFASPDPGWDGSYAYIYEFQPSSGTNIPSQDISIGSFAGTLNANGIKYLILADNSDVDVTPNVAGANYYSFNISQQKYNSYFEVFVNQPYPGTTYYSIVDETAGHAFWQFKTDAPNDALQYIASSLTNFVNHSWGFYPNGSDCGLIGQLQNDDSHVFDVKRVFYIGFDNLITGLQFTRQISGAPPEYCIAVNGYSCVSAATAAGSSVGITLPTYWNPWNWTPQNFGASVVLAFPGPLDDETPLYSK